MGMIVNCDGDDPLRFTEEALNELMAKNIALAKRVEELEGLLGDYWYSEVIAAHDHKKKASIRAALIKEGAKVQKAKEEIAERRAGRA